jgi:hypothetical protein
MSLLMEALKKAEEAKRRAGEGSESPELTLEPLTAQNAATSPLPDLAQHFATVDADLASIPTDAPPRRRPGAPTPPESNAQAAREGAERATVRNAFAAKETPPARPRLGLLLGAGTLALLAIGFLMLPKSWVSDDERRPPLAAPAQNVTIDETGAGVPETSPALSNPVQVMRFKAANADAWVSGVPIGAVRAKLILIDGRIHKLGEPIPPFNLRWQGRDAQDRIVFEGPDGVVRTRVL